MILTYPTCVWHPRIRVIPFEFRRDHWH